MKLSQFYREAVAIGMANDPRGTKAVREELKRGKKKFEGMSAKAQEYFDRDALKNPYSDTRIVNGTVKEPVRRIMVGIDIDAGEVALCDRLQQKGERVDLILAHHPIGRAMARLFDVMKMRADILALLGVSISTAESLLDTRIKEVQRRFMPANHTRGSDAARLLGIPMMCVHTPADNMVHTYLQRELDRGRPYSLDDVLDLLMEQPEYQEAARNGAGPKIVLGNKNRRAGRIFVDMTGGTSGNKKAFEKIAASGVNTIVGMHISDAHRDEARKHHLNFVIAGHISSDTLGMNRLLDKLSVKASAPFETLDCSGFHRHCRS